MKELFFFKRNVSIWRHSLNLSVCSITIIASLSNSTVIAAEQNRIFNIPRQALSSALNTYAEIANISISYSAELTSGIQTAGVTGQFTADKALQKLLAGTGVIARTTANGTITLEKAPKPSNDKTSTTATLPTVKVMGKPFYNVKNPYNEDYALPNATAGTKTDTPIMETPLNIQVETFARQKILFLD